MNPVLKTLIRLQNPMMKWLLRSPLHVIVSRMYMLITFTGRKSGKVYTTPVQYAQEGHTLTVISSAEYKWWKNLRGGADVRLLLRGQEVIGRADATTDPTAIAAAIARVYPSLSEEARADFVNGKVAITIQLADSAQSVPTMPEAAS